MHQLRDMAEAELRKAKLPEDDWRGIEVDLPLLRRNPGASPLGAFKPRLRPLRWSDERRSQFIKRHGYERFRNHPDRTARVFRRLSLAESAPSRQQLSAYRAFAAACLAACAYRVTITDDKYDSLLLGSCIDYWLHQSRIDRTLTQIDRRIHQERGAGGGSAGRGNRSNSTTRCSGTWPICWKRMGTRHPAGVRNAIKTVGWERLKEEWKDPPPDVLQMNVRGSVIDVEYTTPWAKRHHRRTRFVEIDDAALTKTLNHRSAG